MKTIWKFSLGIDATSKLHPHAIGIDCDNLDDTSRLASLVGRTEELKIPCAVHIAEPENSARLLALLAAIKETVSRTLVPDASPSSTVAKAVQGYE